MNNVLQSVLVKCPSCGNSSSPEEALGHQVRLHLEREFEEKYKQAMNSAEERMRREENERIKHLKLQFEEERRKKSTQIIEMEKALIGIEERELRLKDKEEKAELEMKRRLLEREKLIREQADKTATEKALLQIREKEERLAQEREQLDLILKKRLVEVTERVRCEEQMKMNELQKKLADQTKMIYEMKRKAEQGSMQTQGEVQELIIEEFLTVSFPRDEVVEIQKGKRGGDCVHVVRDHYGNVCGRILYESKRTKHFSHDWLLKIKADQRNAQADIAVIVTEAMPEQISRFGELEGVWICGLQDFKALSFLFRQYMYRLGEVMSAQENRGDKINMIYQYVTGKEFKQKLEGAFEAYRDMQVDLQKEKTLFMAHWAKREKKLLQAMESLVSLYGDVRGIAGGAVQEILALETGD